MMGVLVENDNSSATWIPPPKKKWIRHYLLSEVPKDYKTYSALQNSPPPATAPPISTVASEPTALPPPPPSPILQHRPTITLPPPPPPPLPPPLTIAASKSPTINNNGYSNSVEGSYLAARLTAPCNTPASSQQHNNIINNNNNISNNVNNHHHHTNNHLHVSPPPSVVYQPVNEHDLKRRIGAGTREVHNKLEKNRRAHLKECFDLLRRQLPQTHDDKKPSNLSVLHSAIRYIQSLKRKERDYEHEMERLAREKISCQQRLSALKKELSAQWDHIDFAALLPEAPPPSLPLAPQMYSRSRTFDSDDDFEFEEDEEEMRRSVQRTDTTSQLSASTSTASERGQTSDVEDLSSRPGSSRDVCSPPPAPSLPATPAASNMPALLPALRPSVVEAPRSELKKEIKTEPEDSKHQVHVSPSLHLQPQLVASHTLHPGTTLVAPTIQLVPALRMITPDHRNIRTDDGKPKLLGGFLSSADSRLPGGAEINVVTTAALVRAASKPVNLTSKPQILNGSVISHISGGVLTSAPTHHLSTATGITHVVTAASAAHLSALAPLVAAPVTMVAPGTHHPGVHILATHPGKSPFQVVSGPILKQVVPGQYLGATSTAQLVKPVVMLSTTTPTGMSVTTRPSQPNNLQ